MAITLYTSDASVQQFRAFGDVLSRQLAQPVHLRPLSELPPPNPLRRQQQLRAELGTLQAQLDSVDYLLTVGQSEPRRYEQELTLLRQDRTRIEGVMAGVEQQLREAGRAAGPQEGGEPR
ncbi:hypothetical protein [Hymenobacter psychrotolerans]|uniref:Uncharacterized protein n=1 Tax=Hymenobacter psychrotolerans DSM 18569 TaxID=1121959 RepID=A0A1M7E5P3_9BACT|nr:hypothetical protein [Hymenobacter psychrotolerans]SHL87085.1 hypothetical protein SAMN02746009_03525 [Hymenobacter psychrotolerans DSM 18569]